MPLPCKFPNAYRNSGRKKVGVGFDVGKRKSFSPKFCQCFNRGWPRVIRPRVSGPHGIMGHLPRRNHPLKKDLIISVHTLR